MIDRGWVWGGDCCWGFECEKQFHVVIWDRCEVVGLERRFQERRMGKERGEMGDILSFLYEIANKEMFQVARAYHHSRDLCLRVQTSGFVYWKIRDITSQKK